MKKLLILIISSILLLIGCQLNVESENLDDNDALYENEDPLKFYELQLTVFRPENNTLAEGAFTFEELNTGRGKKPDSNQDIEVSGLLKEVVNGESKPGLLGYGLTEPNATVEQRGQSARLLEQKSYEINLLKNGGLFYGHEILNLNKHVEDPTKIYNKLSFDLFKKSNEILSLQTNFVNLWIKDLNIEHTSFKDYGLFTQVEEVDENYFEKRNLDPEGHLYKAVIFEFREYDEIMLRADDQEYSKEAFEGRLEIEGPEDHGKLIQMLEDVNNPLIPINDVITKHFNRENYLTWLASNILLGNVDTASGNYYLYSPKETLTWYFIPWDYDKSLRAYVGDESTWKKGLANYWGSVLHQRFLKNDKNRKDLTRKIHTLTEEVYTKENINGLIKAYEPVLRKSFSKEPDKKSPAAIDELINTLYFTREDILKNRDGYYETLEEPMPFFLGSVVNHGNYVSVNWSESYDFQDDPLEYRLMVSDTPTMENPIYDIKGITDTEYIIDGLPSGQYYFKVIVSDPSGHTQEAFDNYVDRVNNLYYFGVKAFYIE